MFILFSMDGRIKKYMDAIIEAKWWEKNLFLIPTDIIGFWEFGKNLDIQDDDVFHFWWFKDMFRKTELMIFTKELPEEYLDNLNGLNKSVTIIIDSNFKTNIEKFRDNWFSNNIVIV